MKLPAPILLVLALAAAPAAAAWQAPTTGPVGSGGGGGGGDGPTPGQQPVKPRGDVPEYGGPGDTVPPHGPPGGPQPPGPSEDGPGGDGVPPIPPSGGAPGGDGPPPVVPPVIPGGLPGDPLSDATVLGPDLTAWTWWWDLNREPFLVLPTVAQAGRPVTGSGGDFLGGGEIPFLGGRPSEATLYGKIVPALLRVLDKERSSTLASSSAIALARIGAGRAQDKKGAYAEVLRRVLAEGDLGQEQAALLALGILGDDGSAPFLAGVLLETRDAREALGQTRVPEALRAYAAYALGILGNGSANEDVRRYAVHQLVWCLETDKSRSVDLAAACVNALGVIAIDGSPAPAVKDAAAPPGASLAAQIDYLLALLDEDKRDARVRAQAPIALARLLERASRTDRETLRVGVAEELMDRLAAHRREPREVVQSCVIALGRIGDDDGDDVDRRLRRVLVRTEDLVNDVAARQYALISLGRACARRGAGAPDPLKDERAYLLHELGRGGTLSRPWAALAIGIWCREKAGEEDLRRALRSALADAGTDRDVGAFAIGVGLARESGAADLLTDALDGRGSEQTRGHAALALGLAGAAGARPELLATVPEARFQPLLLHDAGLGLALLGEVGVIDALSKVLTTSQALSTQAAAGLALSRTKDERAAVALLALLDDDGASALTRAYAASALGNLGDARPLPWKAIYSVDANLHAAPASLIHPAGGGLLHLY